MLKELRLTNFKPFGKEQCAKLAPITVVYGPNSGGKSSLIQALLMMKQTMEGAEKVKGLLPRGSLVDLGSFGALIHRHDLERKIALSFSFCSVNEPKKFGFGYVPKDYVRNISFVYEAAPIVIGKSTKRHSSEMTEARYCLSPTTDAPPLNIQMEHFAVKLGMLGEFYLDAPGDNSFLTIKDPASLESLVSYIRHMKEMDMTRRARHRESQTDKSPEGLDQEFDASILDNCLVKLSNGIPSELILQPDENFNRLEIPHELRLSRYRVIEGMGREFNNLMRSISYLGPLRSYPERHYVVHGGTPDSVGNKGEFAPQVLYGRTKTLPSEVSAWFERFDIPYRLAIKTFENEVTGTIIVLTLEDLVSGVIVGPSDVGFGIGQLLPILVEGLVARKKIICVEQPEIHLHPRLQGHLADFIIDTSGSNSTIPATKSSPANQWIVETHSEALILRLQKRIRQGILKAEDVSVLYVKPGSEGSSISQLRLDNDGEFIDPWPDGFFEERFDDLFGES